MPTLTATRVAPRPTSASSERRRLLAGIGLLLGILTWTKPTLDNTNVMSRMGTIQALVERHTFVLDDTDFVNTIDKVSIGGHFYSEKPPLLAVLGAVIYAPLHAAGADLRQSNGPPLAITFGLIGFSFLVCLACFHAAVLSVGLSVADATWMTLMLTLGTLCLPFSITLNNHAFVASWTFVGFYALLRATQSLRAGRSPGASAVRSDDAPQRDGEDRARGSASAAAVLPVSRGTTRWLWYSGGAFALAVGADHTTIIFFLAFFLYALARPELRTRAWAMLIPVAVVLAATAAFNYVISGSPLPVQIHAAYFRYPGSVWTGSGEQLSGVAANTPGDTGRYGLRVFFGENGFLIYCPLLLVPL